MSQKLFPNDVNLYVLRHQDNSDDAELMASVATDDVIHAICGLEGELVQADTVAQSVPGSGRRNVDLQTAVLIHNPGLIAEQLAVGLLAEAADAFCAEAGQATPGARRQIRSRIEQEVGFASINALPADVMSAIERTARQAVADAYASQADPASLVSALDEADVSAAAADVVANSLLPLRSGVAKFVRERDSLLIGAHVAQARAIDTSIGAWLEERIASLDRIAEQAADEHERQLAEANAALANDDEPIHRGRFPLWTRLRSGFVGFFLTDSGDTAVRQPAPEASPLNTALRLLLRARIARAAATRLRVSTAALLGANSLPETEIERLVAPVRAIADRARIAGTTLDERAQEQHRRIRGTFLPALADVRDAVRRGTIRLSGEALMERVIRASLVRSLEPGQQVDEDAFENLALAASRDLTNGVRRMGISQILGLVPPARIDQMAKTLSQLSPSLKFRDGYPAPQTRRRVAVPGGSRSVLGEAIRRRDSSVTVTPSNHPQLAYGVAITEVFAVTDLQEFHGGWREAREEARREGWDKRLVSDRRLLDMDDGITPDADLNRLVVMAIACDALAPSKEPPMAPVGGTWYLRPVGLMQRPSEIEPSRLDALFAGFRLGRSLPEMRKVLRHCPAHRELIEEQWASWCANSPLASRLSRLDSIVAEGRLPSDELAGECREIKNELLRGRHTHSALAWQD